VFERWLEETPAHDFVFAVKGSRFITHNLKLRRADSALGNFFASGVLALGPAKRAPSLAIAGDVSVRRRALDSFMRLLPKSAREAESVALMHDDRLRRGALVDAAANVRYRHAFEVRHRRTSTRTSTLSCASIAAPSSSPTRRASFPYAEEVTADFVYVRLHGSRELYASGYTDAELDTVGGEDRGVAGVGAGRVRVLRQRRQGARPVRCDAARRACGAPSRTQDFDETPANAEY
jgi:uncharacterized protein YecE (DUF72 family)